VTLKALAGKAPEKTGFLFPHRKAPHPQNVKSLFQKAERTRILD
jgi:hypothetical protein